MPAPVIIVTGVSRSAFSVILHYDPFLRFSRK
jgi:hypothetical protein